jgi:large subunit ribosomal protein L1
MFNFN